MLLESEPGLYKCYNYIYTGSIPLSPLSYNIIRSHVFSGTRSSNGGCTNGPSVDGQATVDCGLGTALVDCDSGFNEGDFSALSSLPIFTWNKTASVSQRVSIIFTFNQQISINRIHMFFWNSTSDNIRAPSVTAYWSRTSGTPPSNRITADYSTNCSGGISGCVLTITSVNSARKFQYLRIVMTFYTDHDWIFLSEMQFCGKLAKCCSHVMSVLLNSNVVM